MSDKNQTNSKDLFQKIQIEIKEKYSLSYFAFILFLSLI